MDKVSVDKEKVVIGLKRFVKRIEYRRREEAHLYSTPSASTQYFIIKR